MALLNFNDIDLKVVEKYCKRNKGILRNTAIKEQCFHKIENWWYFFTILEGEKNADHREYIQVTLRKMASTSLHFAALYLLTTSKGSPEEAVAMGIIVAKVSALKGKLRNQATESLRKCPKVEDRLAEEI